MSEIKEFGRRAGQTAGSLFVALVVALTPAIDKMKQFIEDLKEFGTALLIAVVILLLWAETWLHRAWLEVKKGE